MHQRETWAKTNVLKWQAQVGGNKKWEIVLKGLSEHFSEKICCKGGETGEGFNN